MDSVVIQKFLEAWHQTVEKKDIHVMDAFVSPDVVLTSPALYHPKKGKDQVIPLLKDVLASFKDYRVTKTWVDGNEILLEFDAQVGNRSLQGIDRITLDSQGKLIHLKVYIRPYSGLTALIGSVIQLAVARQEQGMSRPRKLITRSVFVVSKKLQALQKLLIP